jgi:hypothetical protein
VKYKLLSYDLSGNYVYAEADIYDDTDNFVDHAVFGIDISDLLDSVGDILENACEDKNAVLWSLYVATSNWLDSKKGL